MKQKHYRVYLYPESNFICDKLANLACRSNGENGSKRLSLIELKGVFKQQAFEYEATGKDCTCEIIGEHTLHIDKRKGDKFINILTIEEVELFVPEPELPPYLLTENETY